MATVPSGAMIRVVTTCALDMTACSMATGAPSRTARRSCTGTNRSLSPFRSPSMGERSRQMHKMIATTVSDNAVPNAAPVTPRSAPRQRKRAQLPRGEDQQGVEHHVQPAHEHQQYAGRPHISARLQQAHRQPVQLHKGQRQCEDQEIRGRARTDRAVRVEPVGKPPGDGTAHGGNKQPEGEPGTQPLLHQIPRVLFLACADALRHHNRKAHY